VSKTHDDLITHFQNHMSPQNALSRKPTKKEENHATRHIIYLFYSWFIPPPPKNNWQVSDIFSVVVHYHLLHVEL
jgi:hypothetical protein